MRIINPNEEIDMDITVSDICRFVDIYCDVAGEGKRDIPASTKEAMADAVAEDFNRFGVYVAPE